MPNLGPTELIIILLIIIAIFGAGKLADLGGALGRGIGDFRKAARDSGEDAEEETPEPKVAAKKIEAKPEPAAAPSEDLGGAASSEA